MWELLQRLMKDENLKDFNLVGGTALSLMIGHRQSIDIDLFTTKDFDANKLFKHLHYPYGVELKETTVFSGTVLTYIDDIKVDILSHKYPILSPIECNDGIRLISNEDIGAMKLHAMHQSGERYKDFIDMYFLLEQEPLKFYLDAYQKKYNINPYWAAIGLVSYDKLTLFEGIDMLPGKQRDWNDIKKRLELATKNTSHKFTEEKQILPPDNNNKRKGFRR